MTTVTQLIRANGTAPTERREIATRFDAERNALVWELAGAEPVLVFMDKLSESVRIRGLRHGIGQTVDNAGAMGKGKWDGEDKPSRYATPQERLERMRRRAEHLNTGGDWGMRPSSDPLANLTAEQLRALDARVQAKLAALGVKSAG